MPELGPHHCNYCGRRAEKPLIHYIIHCQETKDLRDAYEREREGRDEDRAAKLVKRALEDPGTLLSFIRIKPPPR